MSNLSELIPAGGAGKNVSFVASGTLPNGRAVVLKADGTVELVASSGSAATIPSGSLTTFEAAQSNFVQMAFDPNDGSKFVLCYVDVGNGEHGTAIIGTVSGNTISFGTPAVFNAGYTIMTGVAYDTTNKFVVVYANQSNNTYGESTVGTVSGTNISFGTSIVYSSVISQHPSVSFTGTANVFVIAYYYNSGGGFGKAIVGTVSGTSMSYGTALTFNTGVVGHVSLSSDPNNTNKLVLSYQDEGAASGKVVILTRSSTTLTAGTAVTFDTTGQYFGNIEYDPITANRFLLVWSHGAASMVKAVVGSVSGTTISLGTILDVHAAHTTGIDVAFDPNNANLAVISYYNSGAGNPLMLAQLTLSGTTLTTLTPVVVKSTGTTYPVVGYTSTQSGKIVQAFNDTNNSQYGTAIVSQASTFSTTLTSTNFIGMADAAIADTAAGSVTIKGGLAKSVSNVAASMPFGAETVFNAGSTHYPNVAYDPNNANKFVAVYRDHGNSSYGTAIVGTISGTSITFGSEVVFNTGDTQHPMISFDPNTTGKFVVTYQDAGNTNRGTAIVGTISGTSLTFGSETVFETGEAYFPSSSFDPSTAGTFVVAYKAVDNSGYGTAVVGIVSGNSISFGSKQVFNSGVTNFIKAAFDPSTAGRFVVVYRDATNSNQGKAALLTVSGSTISFIDTETFHAASTLPEHIGFDPNTAGKFVVLYGDTSGSTSGTAIVGTVSGSSLSFGSEVVFNSGNSNSAYISFDPNTSGKFLISYSDNGNSGFGTAQVGTLSGTSVSFSTSTVFNSGDIQYPSIAYDPNTANKFVIVYRDKGNASYATAIVGNLSDTLTIGSDYYVQADGTISTTSTSPAVKLGKALSTTSINLEFNT